MISSNNLIRMQLRRSFFKQPIRARFHHDDPFRHLVTNNLNLMGAVY
jgi:hypothetical protein